MALELFLAGLCKVVTQTICSTKSLRRSKSPWFTVRQIKTKVWCIHFFLNYYRYSYAHLIFIYLFIADLHFEKLTTANFDFFKYFCSDKKLMLWCKKWENNIKTKIVSKLMFMTRSTWANVDNVIEMELEEVFKNFGLIGINVHGLSLPNNHEENFVCHTVAYNCKLFWIRWAFWHWLMLY